MHRAQHAGDEAIDSPALLDQWDKSRNSALVVCRMFEVSENHPLEGIDLVLKTHKIGYRFVSSQNQGFSIVIQSRGK